MSAPSSQSSSASDGSSPEGDSSAPGEMLSSKTASPKGLSGEHTEEVSPPPPPASEGGGEPGGEGNRDSGLPPYTKWLLSFQAFNALSFTICLGAPMVLTAQFLGAKESWIGVLISLTPFLVILQLFATNLAERWGYRRLMLTGWTVRALALIAIVPLPLLVGRVPGTVLILAMFASHFMFNFVRGFSSGTWFPWLSQLIPEKKRGSYLGLDNTASNLSALLALFGSAWFLGENPAGWRYSVLYTISILAAFTSVGFLRMAPHRMPAFAEARSTRSLRERARVARTIWSDPAFRRITRYVALYFFAIAGVPGFLIVYLKEELHWAEGTILLVQACSTCGVFLTAVLWGRISDRAGSRPLMRLALLGYVLILAFWVFTSLNWSAVDHWLASSSWADLSHVLPPVDHIDPGLWIVGLMFLFMGLCGAAHTVSQVRLILANCPEEEVTVAMAVFQVITSLALGSGPFLWGFILESLRGSGAAMGLGGGVMSPFSVFFLCSFALLLAAQIVLSRVPEPKALPTSGLFVQMFWRWPLRVLSGIVLERRGPGE